MKKKKRNKIKYYCNHVYEVAKKIDSDVPKYGFIQENTVSTDLNEISK